MFLSSRGVSAFLTSVFSETEGAAVRQRRILRGGGDDGGDREGGERLFNGLDFA